MTQKFKMYQRSNGCFYIEDNIAGKQESLGPSGSERAKPLLNSSRKTVRPGDILG